MSQPTIPASVTERLREREAREANLAADEAQDDFVQARDRLLLQTLAHAADLARDRVPTAQHLLLTYTDSAWVIVDVIDGQGEGTYLHTPAVLNEDLSDLVSLGLEESPWLDNHHLQGVMRVGVAQVLGADREQTPNPDTDFRAHLTHRGDVVKAYARARRALAHTVLHSILARAALVIPETQAVTVAADEFGAVRLVDLLDSVGLEIYRAADALDDDEVRGENHIVTLDMSDLAVSGLLGDAGSATAGVYPVSLGEVRRLRGLADDPDQPSLLPLDLTSYGWSRERFSSATPAAAAA